MQIHISYATVHFLIDVRDICLVAIAQDFNKLYHWLEYKITPVKNKEETRLDHVGIIIGLFQLKYHGGRLQSGK